jgi:hypothetical protein
MLAMASSAVALASDVSPGKGNTLPDREASPRTGVILILLLFSASVSPILSALYCGVSHA